ncbi:MAG TPA: glycoside hydrolase family 127 protein [Candidatus Eisenbergiella merdipullorum]|uniref:Glycoside hydrolase family 127 protein n=1 Tax=Candidatus Eisenbergiella merdipullorum TaxID=2838553 RepID=A0A9D2I5C6_9FIRM|nr:glycoside hydrolase family 127 protein [Candidatus Eisenbergiella merdipullorum]
MKVQFGASKLSTRYSLLAENFLKINADKHARAYVGEHDGGYADIEFAGKYLDTCVRFYNNSGDAEFLNRAEIVADSICDNQRSDGYLGGLIKGKEWEGFSVWNQAFTVYGLVSYFKATQDKRALAASEKCISYIADHYMYGGGDITDGSNNGTQNLSILIAVAVLYQVDPKEQFKDFMLHIADKIRHSDNNFFEFDSILNLRSKKGIENFVILIGMLIYGDACCDPSALQACEKYWKELNDTQIRETGNGSTGECWNDRGNQPMFLGYDVRPNENCVAVGWFELSSELFRRTGKACYLDAMEKTLYNHILGSMDAQCSDFAYYQPNYGIKYTDSRTHAVYLCCRYRGYSLFSQLPECLFAADDHHISPMLYTDCDYYDGSVKIEERTRYPYDGAIEFRISGSTDKKLKLRIPVWCQKYAMEKNGMEEQADLKDGFISTDISDGDTIVLRLEQELCFKPCEIDGTRYVSACYGCILLAADSALNEDIYDILIDVADPHVKTENQDKYDMVFSVDGFLKGKKQRIKLVDYASSGKAMVNSEYTIYMKY